MALITEALVSRLGVVQGDVLADVLQELDGRISRLEAASEAGARAAGADGQQPTAADVWARERGQYTHADQVVALVRASRAACNVYFCTPQPTKAVSDAMSALEDALKPFEDTK